MFRLFLTILILCFLASSCSRKYKSYSTQYQFPLKKEIPDYSLPEYWAAHPWKKDPSDSLPDALKAQVTDSLVDVFYLHPTTYTGTKEGWNADINDPQLNAKTDYYPVLYQASVFNEHCRVFAPRYRQAHISAFFLQSPETIAAFDTAYSDLKRAFEFYMAHYNNGRPIIIAGHSQGGLMALRLLKEFFDSDKDREKLVAAYVLGWPVTSKSFSNLPPCRDSLQTSCFCSWRTFRRDYIPAYIEEESPQALVTNPLNWSLDTLYAPREKNRGSVLHDFNQLLLLTTDAQVHEGVLWVNRPKFPGSLLYRSRNYHIGDINLFYMNIRDNVEQRIEAYRRLHGF